MAFYGKCPRCRAPLELVDGWREYGDQLVEIQTIGCFACGWNEDMHEEEEEDYDRYHEDVI